MKLLIFERIATEVIKLSLMTGKGDCLKARPDGMLLDGHHRIYVLRRRGVNVDELPREIVTKSGL